MTIVRQIARTKEADARAELNASALWAQLEGATPAQIRNWMSNNVTSLTEAHEVLTLILLALRALHK